MTRGTRAGRTTALLKRSRRRGSLLVLPLVMVSMTAFVSLGSQTAASGTVTPYTSSPNGSSFSLSSGMSNANNNNGNGTPLAGGVADGHTSLCVNPGGVASINGALPWTVRPASCDTNNTATLPYALPAHPVVVAPQATFPGVISDAQWVSVVKSASDTSEPAPYYYDYDAEFSLPTNCPNATLSGTAFANDAVGVYLNGNYLASEINGAALLSYSTTNDADFVVNATNVVDFIVHDTAGPTTGLDYHFTVTPQCAVVKVCKVAGLGVATGTDVTFTVTTVPPAHDTAVSTTLTVPAGPAPGGYCQLAGPYLPGTVLDVAETLVPPDTVSSITKTPSYLAGTVNLGAGTVSKLVMRLGVNLLTYTDTDVPSGVGTGYVEICKQLASGGTGGLYTFNVTYGSVTTTVSVPAGACTPPIVVEAGAVTVTEVDPTVTAISVQPPQLLVSDTVSTGTTNLDVPAQPAGSADGLIEAIVSYTNANPVSSISLVKSAIATGYSPVDNTITYSYIVTNTGTTNISNVAVSDNLVAQVICPPDILLPGGSETCTGTYTVTQGDLAAESVTNTATATAASPQGTTVTSTNSSVTVPNNCDDAYAINDDDYASDGDSDSVTAVNTVSNALRATPPSTLPLEDDAGVSSPWAIAITPDCTTAYVVDSGLNSVTPINLLTGAMYTPIPVGVYPVAIAITPNGKTAYVANLNDNTVTPINLTTSPPTPEPAITVGNQPTSIAISSDGLVYVVGENSNGQGWMYGIDSTNDNAIESWSPLAVGYGISFVGIYGSTAYAVSTGNTGTDVVPINLLTSPPTVGAGIPDAGGGTWSPLGLSGYGGVIAMAPNGPNGPTAYVTGEGDLCAINLMNDAETLIPVGSTNGAIAVTPDGKTVYVGLSAAGSGNTLVGTVLPIDVSGGNTFTPETQIPIGTFPSAIAVAP